MIPAMILLMGVELGKESIGKVLHPEDVTGSPLVLAILAVSIAVKLYMMAYNRRIGKKLNAPALLAAAADSLSDSVARAITRLRISSTNSGVGGLPRRGLMVSLAAPTPA